MTRKSGDGLPPKPRAWARPSEVPAGAGVADQLELMRMLVDGRISAPDFAKSWLAARRRVLDEERVRAPFERILTEVFYALDDYVIDPALRDDGDMSDADLVELVREGLGRLDTL